MQITKKNLLHVHKLESGFTFYYSLHVKFDRETYFITDFLREPYYQVAREGIMNYINDLYIPDGNGDCNMMYEMVTITIDPEFDMIYLHEDTLYIRKRPMTPQQELIFNGNADWSYAEICRNKIIDTAAMTKDNFIHILTKWGQLYDQTPPFILLYQNDQDWYELEPFETQEAMEQFVVDHTEKITE